METLKARLFLALIFGLIVSDGWAKIAPELGRDSLQTPHFRIHYPPHYQEFSRTLAAHLEEAFSVLANDLRWTPNSRTEVVVRGDTDHPNGTAEVFPYNRLVIHAVPPEPWGFFSESDDWIRTLAIHELTHVIANDQTSGFFALLRKGIGTAAKINPYQPAWLVEGLAVYAETRYTAGGRGRSTWNGMVVRTAIETNRFDSEITLDRLNDGVPGWPAGHTPYLFGYVLNEAIATRGGADAPAAISGANSAHLPFVIDRVARSTLGTDYAELWKEVGAKLREKHAQDLTLISREPLTESAPITRVGRKTRGWVPVSREPGRARFYFIRDSARSGPGLSWVGSDGRARDVTFWRWDGGTRIELSPDGNFLAYSRIAPYLEHSLYSDLYLYDLAGDREIRLTTGKRGSDPVLSEDFAWDPRAGKISSGAVTYVKNLGDGSAGIARWDGSKETVVYRGENFSRIGAPTAGRGEFRNWVVFAEKPRSGGERLMALNLVDRRSFALTTASAENEMATTPDWDASGEIYFVSGRGGVMNAFRIPAARVRSSLSSFAPASAERVTHLTTGILQPRRMRGSEDLYGLVYGPGGWDLAKFSGAAGSRVYSSAGPGLPTLYEKLSGTGSTRSRPVAQAAAGTATAIEPSRYSVLPALLPHYWAPDVRRVPDGWTLGALTSSFDAWESHRYRLFAGADTRASFPIWDVNYQFDGFFPTFEFSMRQENRYFANYLESNRIQTTEGRVYTPAGWDSYLLLGATGQTSRFFGEKESTGGFQLGWIFDRTRVFDDSIDRRGESGVRGGTELTGYFGGAERFSALASYVEARVPAFFPRHFFRLAVHHATANNDRLTAHYELGGGEETIASDRRYLLRGYIPGSIFGREILTSNLEYVFPVAEVFRGHGTFPLFWQTTRVKLFVDTGSAEYLADEKDELNHWPVGVGMHVLTDLNLLYRVPVTIGVGVDHGLSKQYGGETRFVLGLFSTLARP